MENMKSLEKLDLRWNKFHSAPEWFAQLEQHGCVIYT
jgi:hypothetical protein